MSVFFKMAGLNVENFLGNNEFIQALSLKSMQEKESNMSLRIGKSVPVHCLAS